MSLSQKHSGKVLVPWFNVNEWKAVFNLIYSDNGKDWPKALEILKIWKIRTPLLSAGVEGTLIVLEALLINTNLSSYEVTHIFATSLVRFLNLCAANSDKQGTFYKTAMKNGLPKWLINLRHDIAHSHNVPPLSMLELSLKFCLEWLREKYWKVQEEYISDFVAGTDESVADDTVYIIEKVSVNRVLERNKKLMACAKKYIKYSNKQLTGYKCVESVLEALKKAIRKSPQSVCDRLCKLLIDDYKMFPLELETDDAGNLRIPENTKSKWSRLLGTLYETEILPKFVHHLFDFICNVMISFKIREIASFWIRDIFDSLPHLEHDSCEESKIGDFSNVNRCMKDRSFTSKVLSNPMLLSLNFIEEILKYNDAPTQFIEDSVNLISAFSAKRSFEKNGIFTVKDLKIDLDQPDDVVCELGLTLPPQRWVAIEDTSLYETVPLGVLPHQERYKNPLL